MKRARTSRLHIYIFDVNVWLVRKFPDHLGISGLSVQLQYTRKINITPLSFAPAACNAICKSIIISLSVCSVVQCGVFRHYTRYRENMIGTFCNLLELHFVKTILSCTVTHTPWNTITSVVQPIYTLTHIWTQDERVGMALANSFIHNPVQKFYKPPSCYGNVHIARQF